SRERDAYFDAVNRVIWWETSHEKRAAIKAVKSGSTARLDNNILKYRYNSKNQPWTGYTEWYVNEEKA
ncbi:MAG: hypothetical protein IKU18_03520, partial [Bacteroidales bacterium]|nr:hypothetical protein [Bacteroidales bacterium]